MTSPFVILPQAAPAPLPKKYPWSRKLSAVVRFPILRAAGYPTLVNLEVTHRCNARCGFCRYWTTRSEQVLTGYAPVVRKLKPAALVFTGGEALIAIPWPSRPGHEARNSRFPPAKSTNFPGRRPRPRDAARYNGPPPPQSTRFPRPSGRRHEASAIQRTSPAPKHGLPPAVRPGSRLWPFTR